MASERPNHPLDEDWARSYARQAISDLNAREILADKQAAKCHRLHFLQMAAEKACKAYLVSANGHKSLRKTHAYVESVLPIIAKDFYSKLNENQRIKRWELAQIRKLAREIELLAPACDYGETRRDNTEYPWEAADGEVCTPCEYSFPNLDDRSLVRLVKLVRTAAESYSQ